MKVHRIITTIEVENDNSITSVELTKLSLDNIKHPLVVTNITTNGSANDIEQVYDTVDKCRLDIAIKLKSIVHYINTALTQSGVRGESPIEPDSISITNLARHDDNLNDIRHDETNGDRTSDDLY